MDDRTDATLPDTRHQHTDPVPRVAASELGERYAVGPLLGRGGMGEVRLARDLRIDREVAVKLMRSNQRDEHTLGRFFREARVQGVLEHPAVVPVHDLGIDGEGNPYFVMKRLAGITLHDVITSKDPAIHDRWPRRTLLARLVDVCLAIEFAHTRGVVHRDLKPANIMLGDYGEAYVLDWGLAKISDDGESFRGVATLSGDDVGNTVAGELLGTPGYMSPEQARGEPIDGRTDVFALGVVLYEILAGVTAMPRGAHAIAVTLSADHHRPSSRAPDVPPELDDLCARATDASPASRPKAGELANKIQAYLDGDRDVAQRRELAEVHARRAHEAMAQPGDEARATAIREAGSALVLDPANSTAQAILRGVLLDVPDTIPTEALASADEERGRVRQSSFRKVTYTYLGALPVLLALLALPLRHAWPIVYGVVVLALTAGLAWILAKRRMPMRSWWFVLFTFLNCATISTVGLLVGPMLVMPFFLIGSLSAFLSQPSTHHPAMIVGLHLLPIVVLFGLEWLGVLPHSYEVTGGSLVFTPWAMEMTPTSIGVLFAFALAVQFGSTIDIQLAFQRAQRDAQNRIHAQSWHLRQLLPRERDDAAR